jgi:hypothetical protein
MLGKRRALGEIIAAMVLLLIVSLGGGLLFSISMREGDANSRGLRDELDAESSIVQEKFKIISIGPDNDDKLCVWILNYGSVDIKIDQIYVNNIQYDTGDYDAELVNPLDSQLGSSYITDLDLYSMDVKKITFTILTHTEACESPGEIVVSSERGVSVYGKCG